MRRLLTRWWAWLGWRHEVRRLQREENLAYARWRRATWELQDIATVSGVGSSEYQASWGRVGDAFELYVHFRDQLRRLRECP